ncbi:MAG: hypothetical protein JSV58_05330 [Candidatus Bathyarchaeota archaeon]|nr:MAG: hypothetical protein JSV58_05330 [Candidatus Bathyarchaeota archaeon]
MAKTKKTRTPSNKFIDAVLTIVAIVLIFAGPTYLMYFLQRVGTPAALYYIVGLAAFVAGVILFWLRHEKA